MSASIGRHSLHIPRRSRDPILNVVSLPGARADRFQGITADTEEEKK
jgi:hypothetical protein